jgi:hypothetical protein
MGGRQVQKNFADKAEAKRAGKQILGGLTNDAEAVEAVTTPEKETLVARNARRISSPRANASTSDQNYAPPSV